MSPKIAALILIVLPWLTSLAQTSPGSKDQAALHMQKAQEYLAQRRPDLAIPELQEVVALDPSNVNARANLGVLLFFRSDYAGALPDLHAAVQMKPDLWKIQGLLGLDEAHLQNADASRSDLAAAFPHLTEPQFQLEVGQALIDNYTATEDLDKAAAVVADLLSTRPTDVHLLYLSYRLYSDLAGRSMLTLALSAPNSAEMHQVMARELARRDDNAPAIANYREALRIDPKLPGAHTELGDLLFHSPDVKLQAQAKVEFEAALAVNPRDEQAQLLLGEIAEQSGDLATALADDTRALQLDPNDTDACVEAGKVLVLMNQRDKAQQMFERAVQIDPSNYVAHYRLAAIYRQEDRPEDVKQQIAEYEKYKQMKDKLEQIFQQMRVASGLHPDKEDAGPQP
ncbi:MAG: tetratricopeptide repeat protein [Acidobacteriaceae bacterium]